MFMIYALYYTCRRFDEDKFKKDVEVKIPKKDLITAANHRQLLMAPHGTGLL